MQDTNRRSATNFPALEHSAEYPFKGHDTVPGQIIDSASVVAFIPLLGDLHQRRVSKVNPGAYRDILPFNADVVKFSAKSPKPTSSPLFLAYGNGDYFHLQIGISHPSFLPAPRRSSYSIWFPWDY